MPDRDSRSLHTLATTTHGRYVVRRARAGQPRGLLAAFHGYGQDAQAFLDDVEAIPGADGWTVVSVQALHPFYTRAGEVVANWMTSQDRELAITDNVAYVRAVVARVRSDEPSLAGAPVVFLGFSQGVAMAFRAAAHADRSDGVIALGGDVPPEVRASGARVGPVLLGRGARDEWYTRDKYEKDLAWLRDTDQIAEACAFEGGHEWSDAFRERAGAFLDRVATVNSSTRTR